MFPNPTTSTLYDSFEARSTEAKHRRHHLKPTAHNEKSELPLFYAQALQPTVAGLVNPCNIFTRNTLQYSFIDMRRNETRCSPALMAEKMIEDTRLAHFPKMRSNSVLI